jgi:hypothetical protein
MRGGAGPGSMSGARRKGKSSCTNGVAHDNALDRATNATPLNPVKGLGLWFSRFYWVLQGSTGFYRVRSFVLLSSVSFIEVQAWHVH